MTMTHTRTLRVRRLGRMEYGAALKLQKETELAVRDGGQPDTLLLARQLPSGEQREAALEHAGAERRGRH